MPEHYIIKTYDHMALLRLIMDHIRLVHGVQKIDGQFNYFEGLDQNGDVYIRVSLKPIWLPNDPSRSGG